MGLEDGWDPRDRGDKWQKCEMPTGAIPCEGALCLLETVSHHKDFGEMSSSELTTPKRMCVWSSHTFGLFINEAANRRTLQQENTYPSKKNTLEAYWEQEEKEVQKLKSSQSNKRFSMWKLSLTLQREQKGIAKKCVSIAKKRELSSLLCTDWRDAKSLNNQYVPQIYTIIVFSFQCRSAS